MSQEVECINSKFELTLFHLSTARQIGIVHLAIWHDATTEAVAFGLVCCLDNCCQAVIGLSAGGCELLQQRSGSTRSGSSDHKICKTQLTATPYAVSRTTPSAVLLDKFTTLLN